MINAPPKEIRSLSVVKRWPVTRTIQTQSVAEHSYYVAIYTKWLCELMNLEDWQKKNAVEYALFHDMKEIVSGDIPTPFKTDSFRSDNRADELFEKLTGGYKVPRHTDMTVVRVVKLADMIEAWCFLNEEIDLGNREANKIGSRLGKEIHCFAEQHFPELTTSLLEFFELQRQEQRVM